MMHDRSAILGNGARHQPDAASQLVLTIRPESLAVFRGASRISVFPLRCGDLLCLLLRSR